MFVILCGTITMSDEKAVKMLIKSWLESRGFSVRTDEEIGGRGIPDIIAENKNEKWIVEVKDTGDASDVDSGIGQLLRRMDTYRGENVKFYLAIHFKAMKRIPSIALKLGIGFIFFEPENQIFIHVPAKITPFKTFYRSSRTTKTEILRIRCRKITKNTFYQFARERGAQTLEDALIELLECGMAFKPKERGRVLI